MKWVFLKLLIHSVSLPPCSSWKDWQPELYPPGSRLERSLEKLTAAVTSVVSDSVWPHRCQPIRLPRPWDSPGKNTGVGCHFLLQSMKVKSESEVAQLYPTLSDPMDRSLPGSSVHGIFQARVLEWGAIAFSGRIWLAHEKRLKYSITMQLNHPTAKTLPPKPWAGSEPPNGGWFTQGKPLIQETETKTKQVRVFWNKYWLSRRRIHRSYH